MFQFLECLVPFARDQNRISGSGLLHRCPDCFRPIGKHGMRNPVIKSKEDVVYNRFWIF